ncbi:cytochrome P450 [Streptomyces sp. NPDC054887]
MATPMGTLDLFDREYVLDPFPVWDGLRENAPVRYEPDTGLWLVSRYDDVRAVLLDTDTFLVDNAMDAIGRFSVATLRVLAGVRFALPPTLASNGGESHAGYRGLMTRFLGARAVAAAVPMIERVTGECLDEVERRLDADGVCDLATTLARDVPLRVLLNVLGLRVGDEVDMDTLTRWSDASLELFWGRPDDARQTELAGEAADFYAWLRDLVTGQDAAPGTLLAALEAHRLPDGAPATTAERAAVLYFIVIAGQATTRQMLSIMYRRALTEPGLWRRFADRPADVAPWAEEVLRREPPITTWRRVTGRPVTLSGVDLPAGAPLLLMLASTGSDPEVFDEPEQLCPHRPNRRQHLAFGVGRHRCSGAELARAEAEAVLRTTAARLPGLRLANPTTPPPMLGLLSFRAPLHVPVERAASRPGAGRDAAAR